MRKLQVKLAQRSDLEMLRALMSASIATLQKPFLTPEEITASYEVMGLDTTLIEDGTYFSVWAKAPVKDILAGCGGWSRRETLYGGDHSSGRNARLLDPATEPARIRAMYTHPDWVRCGVGRRILQSCEDAARSNGFSRAEMMATLSGVPLYTACGYTNIEKVSDMTSTGVAVPLVRMGKALM